MIFSLIDISSNLLLSNYLDVHERVMNSITLKEMTYILSAVLQHRDQSSLYNMPSHLTTGRKGAKWLSGRVLDSRPRGRRLEPHRRHCVVSLSKNINPSLVLVQPRKTRPFITERLLMGCKESNQTNKTNYGKGVKGL